MCGGALMLCVAQTTLLLMLLVCVCVISLRTLHQYAGSQQRSGHEHVSLFGACTPYALAIYPKC